MDTIADIVEKRIRFSEGFVDERVKMLDSSNPSITSLVPFGDRTNHSTQEQEADWCSLPNKYRLDEVALWCPPPIIPLKPYESKEAFQERWGLSINEVAELAAKGCLHLDIYAWRKVEDWNSACPEMMALVNNAFVMGVAFKSYRTALGIGVNDDARAGYINNILIDQDKIDVVAVSSDEQNAPEISDTNSTAQYDALINHLSLAWGTRLSYLDAFASRSSVEHIEELLSNGELQMALDELRWLKHQDVSPLSAAMGGKCYSGIVEFSRAARTRSHFAQPVAPAVDMPQWNRIDPQLMKLVNELLTASLYSDKRRPVNGFYLAELLSDEGFREEQRKLIAAMQDLSNAWSTDEVDKQIFLERIEEFKVFQKRFMKYEPWILDTIAGSLIGFAFGGPVGSFVGIGVGFALHKFSASTIVAKNMLTLDPRHRLLMRIDEVRSKSRQ